MYKGSRQATQAAPPFYIICYNMAGQLSEDKKEHFSMPLLYNNLKW
jgi:hypothetical protein